jgi:hypothetical protein
MRMSPEQESFLELCLPGAEKQELKRSRWEAGVRLWTIPAVIGQTNECAAS